jgi:hypothetical protein
MSSRLALESWQLLFPAIGIGIFAAVFFAVVIRVWRMRRPAVDHLESLPLADELPLRVDAGVPTASLDSRQLKPGPEAPAHLS